MEYTWLIFSFACMGAFFMAFNNGANDVANAFAAAVGSKAITVRQALLIASFLNLLGALFLGSRVTGTLIESVLGDGLALVNANDYVLGLIGALLAANIFVFFSSLVGIPVSSTHAIVGSLGGMGIVLGGLSALNWSIFGSIALAWILSPLLAATLSWSMARMVKHLVYRGISRRAGLLKRTRFYLSTFCGLLALFLATVLCVHLFEAIWAAYKGIILITSFGLVFTGVYLYLGRLFKQNSRDKKITLAEKAFKNLQIGSASYVAFGHGANDVANSISPVLGVLWVMETGNIPIGSDMHGIVPLWLLLLGGVGMSLGIHALGHRVMQTMGSRLTLLNNSRGFSVDCATATTVVFASFLGIPVSSTHAATGSIVGVGLTKGLKAVNVSILIKIFIAWMITVPCAAATSMLAYWLLRMIF